MSECTEICDGLAARRKWFTTDGLDELDRIAKAELDIDLHKWQREGTARILDGIDVILTIATGSGKSTLFQLYALARLEQIVLVISPLKLLQRNMVFSIDKKKNLNALAINADTISAARSNSHYIWSECANGKYQIILCAPEQLDHEKVKALLENSNVFRRRLGLVVVDKAHLIPLWGGDGSSVAFWSAFFTIGNLQSQLRPETVYLALSATLMPGKPTTAVKACLGFREPNFKLMREDCKRKSLHFIFRRIIARAPARTFPMLDWLIAVGIWKATDILKAVIYVDSVMRGHWIVVYLRSLLPASLQPQAHLIIRHIHASTCPQCKSEAANEFIKDSDLCLLRIVVATEAFGCGIDIRDIRRVVNYGIPHNN
ncbi:hypothetical protein FRC09_006046 [Ceratobasidium sp. 395]|nr:hypothetical protein FRC09_006046 [Ceratobasidium sp. 395]